MTSTTLLAEPLIELSHGQGARQFLELGVALVLSTVIGLEREIRQKSAGLRTHTLVGVGSALFVLVSEYGFSSVTSLPHVALDPSRVAAQVVSGIGFIGGGIIFVRRDAVRGLTTAATVWLACGVGMACGGGLILLAVAVTAVHLLVIYGYGPLAARLLHAPIEAVQLRLRYAPGRGLLPFVLVACTGRGFRVNDVHVAHGAAPPAAEEERAEPEGRDDRRGKGTARKDDGEEAAAAGAGPTEVVLELEGKSSVSELVCEIAEMDGVLSVDASGRRTDPGD